MNHSTRPATKSEQARFVAIRMIGCVPCRIHIGVFRECEVNHVVSGRRREGHLRTYGACPWHHRAVPEMGSPAATREALGPSLMDGSRTFKEFYGNDDFLVAYQDALIEAEAICASLIP